MALYQQGVQKIEVVVRRGASVSEEPAGTSEKENAASEELGEKANGGSGASGTGAVTSSSKRMSRFTFVNLTHSLSVARQTGNLAVNYYLTGMAYKNGDQSYQELVQRQYEQINDVASIVVSFGMGAAYGATGGPVGMLIGGALNASTTAVSTAFKYANRGRDFEIKTFKLDNGIEYQRARAGVNLTTGRLR